MDTFFFDLDGTLLPMPDQERFVQTYFKALALKLLPYGIEEEELIKAIMAGTMAMIDNDGTMTNEKRFWSVFEHILGEKVRELEVVFEDFYQREFIAAQKTTSMEPFAKECIRLLQKKGYRIVLATNPIFPRVATVNRIRWAGLQSEDFEWITTYENSSYCKPNLEYYKEILGKIGKTPQDCIMIGNDVRDDMCAAKLGMDTFLLKDCLINTEECDITNYRQGSFPELMDLIHKLPNRAN
ncbi:MAG: HAD family hydrolase [Clostridiales bacterium]|nr:HAD family hydrolase [Clostridiales bacterium]